MVWYENNILLRLYLEKYAIYIWIYDLSGKLSNNLVQESKWLKLMNPIDDRMGVHQY